MKRALLPAAAALVVLMLASVLLTNTGHAQSTAAGPEYKDAQLQFPSDYREWVFLSSGRGMTYGPAANPNGPPLFDNVYVRPAAYREFMKSGRWPDQTMFVLEIRRAKNEGSINKGGEFQGDLVGIEVEVKDTKRFTDSAGWAFFEFGTKQDPAKQNPQTDSCYSCHSQNGAVEQTFVQFYPTLIDVARKMGTFREGK